MASDQTVTARHVLAAVLELQRRGSDAVVKEMEKLEPDLVEHLLENTCQIHHRLMKLGLPGKQARKIYRQAESITLVCVIALRRAHYDLWNSNHGDASSPDGEEPPQPRDPPSAT
ncbi:hypothetical protein BH10PLA1_BH10PLA1_17200 [soil metagenome]